MTPGQQHEATLALDLLDHAQGAAAIADSAYDSHAIVAHARRRGMKVVVPTNPTRRKQRRPDKKLYRLRYMVECFFHRLKRFRAIATRYAKSASSFLAEVHLACTTMWL